MKHIDSFRPFPKLFPGLFLCALCTAFALHSNLGLSPWAVFHQGISQTLGITFGQANVICSFIIILVVNKMGLGIGLGTVLNMIFIGIFVDLFEFFNVIPDAASTSQGIMMICLSMLFNALGSYFYISCEMGCGPRDGLMSVLTKKSGWPVGVIRAMIELTVFLIGWKLGGQLGFGTILNVFGIGIFVNFVYKLMDFDVASLHHRTFGTHIPCMKG